MKNTWIIAKNELLRYFISPLAYVYLIAFLLLNGSFAVYFGAFFERGNASLFSMFAFQPWIYLLFIPGISMRLWSEEFRSKTIVQIMTMPVSAVDLVWGKFIAAWIFSGIALLLTFPFWITVNILGHPDNSVIAVGYFASFILAGCMLSISQTMSALTKNQVIALVLSVIANLIFFLSGIEYVLGFFRSFAPQSVIDMIASFSFLTHFYTFSNGLLELRDLIFFASVIILFNFTAVLIVSFRTSGTSDWLKSTSRSYYILAFICLLAAFAGLNLLANNKLRNIRYDFTEEKIYTLSDDTGKLLSGLSQPVVARVYYSPVLGERNPDIRNLFDKLRLMLKKYADLSDGRFTFRIYNPQPLDEIEDRALAAGLQPFPIIDLNSNAYFGIAFSDEIDNRQTIPFLSLSRQEFLEQDLTQKIYQLSHPKKGLGIITSLPVFDTMAANNMVTQKWEIIRRLEEMYNLHIIKEAKDFPEGLNLLMMIHPRNLPDDLVSRIKDFSLSGGKALVLLDSAAEAPRIFSPVNQEFYPSELNGLDRFWNFRFHNEVVVADLDNSITVDATRNYKTEPSFTQDVIQFTAQGNGLNHTQPETAGLRQILFASASVITPAGDDKTEFIPLIEPGKNSQLMDISVVYNSLNPSKILKQFQADDYKKVIAAKIISHDPARPFEIIVAGDTDFIYNSFWTASQIILDNTYYIPILDNGNFIFNALESLSGENNLIGLRGKAAKIRKFENIEKTRKNELFRTRLKEDEILARIQKTKDELNEVNSKRNFENRTSFTADELAVIAGVRKKLNSLRQELSNIKSSSNETIRQTGLKVKLYNIYAVPAFIAAVLALLALLRRKNLRLSGESFRLNRGIIRLAAAAAVILGTGILSVYLSENNDIATYEGKPVFPQLHDSINEIDKISLQSNNSHLVFYKQDNIWKLENNPGIPVYQERIRSFLTSLLYASYYEKKSSRAQDLEKFGLQPIETQGSPNLRIELFTEKEKKAADFEIGKYDIDIGRGARGAYIKFAGFFQVWLINADFIDLSAQISGWTYSTLWNLRFGRIESCNGIQNADTLAALMKALLNTPLTLSDTPLKELEKLSTLTMNFEGANRVDVDFYQQNGEYYAVYRFIEPLHGKHLQFFAGYAKGKVYKISKKDWEIINHVISTIK